ncbi:hypothetical protein M5G07_05485 [Serratia symbiotica]|nr:hypothetical protein [Serratia symbiotica]
MLLKLQNRVGNYSLAINMVSTLTSSRFIRY